MSIFSHHSFFFSKRTLLRGFTLIELLVATSIIIIITTVLLFRHERFNSSTLLRSLSYSIALSIRQAQLYGVSVREFEGSFDARSYGVQFVNSSPNTVYYLFADFDNDGGRDLSGEDVDAPAITGGYEIQDFCAVRSGSDECLSNGFITSLSILFRRPNPDACIATNISSSACAPGGSEVYQSACVEVVSPGEDTRTVTVGNTGQISVGESGTTCL